MAVTQRHKLAVFDNAATKTDVQIADGWNDPTAGHGVFIQGLGLSAFPGGDVPLVDVTDGKGLYLESNIARIIGTYAFAAKDVANLSAGTYACISHGETVFPLMLAAMVGVLQTEQVGLVAAAGNNGRSEPFYPAAFGVYPTPSWAANGSCPGGVRDAQTQLCMVDRAATVTSVGSVTSTTTLYDVYPLGTVPATISAFSNRGGWVEQWSDGDGVVGMYTAGAYRYCVRISNACDKGDGTTIPLSAAPTAHLGSTVRWSGTSFAAPQAAIALAALP